MESELEPEENVSTDLHVAQVARKRRGGGADGGKARPAKRGVREALEAAKRSREEEGRRVAQRGERDARAARAEVAGEEAGTEDGGAKESTSSSRRCRSRGSAAEAGQERVGCKR